MTTNKFKQDLIDLANEIEQEVVEELAPPENPTCELCGAKKFQKKKISTECAMEMYAVDCPGRSCTGTTSFTHYYIEVGDSIPIVNRDFKGVRCTGEGCDGTAVPPADIILDHEPFERQEYILPIKGILTTNIHEHHTSYVPEETITVCAQCHMNIHRDEDFRPDLEPEMSRSEWEEMKDD